MSLESMISGLSQSEKLMAMDLIWRDLSRSAEGYVSPQWHERVIADRLKNPETGARLELDEARTEIKAQFDARRTQD